MKWVLILVGVLAATGIELAILVPLIVKLVEHMPRWTASACVVVSWAIAFVLARRRKKVPPRNPLNL